MSQGRGRVAPYKPTPPSMVRIVSRLLGVLAVRWRGRQPILYEAGCGLALVSRVASRRHGYYSVCVEIDGALSSQARLLAERSGVGHLVEVVEADVLSFSPRRATVVYVYLLPTPMERIGVLTPRGALLLALEYPSPGLPLVGVVSDGSYTLYVHSTLLRASRKASSAKPVSQSSPSLRRVSGRGTPSSAS